MSFKPLEDRVLVRRHDSEELSQGGIIIPDAAKEKPSIGTVISVGDGKPLADGSRAPVYVDEGDTVLFSKYSGTEIKLDGVTHLILKEGELLGVQG